MTSKTSHINVHDNFVPHKERLLAAGLRPTRQRLAICEWMFDGRDKHFTAEELYRELSAAPHPAGQPMSLATVYNTLKGFTEAGLLSTLNVDSGKMYYDTNTSHHYHLYDAQGRHLSDIETSAMSIMGLPDIGDDLEIDRVDVIIRTRPKAGQFP
jgi:Fur family iron response transcriptional regulator